MSPSIVTEAHIAEIEEALRRLLAQLALGEGDEDALLATVQAQAKWIDRTKEHLELEAGGVS